MNHETMDSELARVFVRFSVEKLEKLSERIDDCLGRLTTEQVWTRGCDAENAVGNLVLHLCGNVRQWIGFGVAGKADVRARDSEFQARGDVTSAELRDRLRSAVAEAILVVQGINPERLTEKTNVQGYDVTVLEAVYHVVEHFAQHTGQIISATKRMTQRDLGYYGHLTKGGTAGGAGNP
jgi:uncharacterized damage-inducible protein DinB